MAGDLAPLPAVTLRQAEALVGLEHVPGQFDCMHLAVLAQRVLFNRVVPWAQQQHPRGGRHQAVLIARHCAGLARPLAADDTPGTGDAVLWTNDNENGSARCFHIGTLFVQGGERWVLHSSQALGSSVLQRLAECPAQGLRFEGFYRWLA
jgi:hypothetical protein